MKRNFVILIPAFLLAFGAAEIILRIFPTEAVYFQTRNVVQQTHSVPDPDPVLKYVPAPSMARPFSNLEFKTMIYTNARGMRSRDYTDAKPQGVKRVMVLGDSFTFGWGVENPQIFTQILEDRLLSNVEVWNLGVSGYSVDQELVRLERAGLAYQPDIVLMEILGEPTLSDGNFVFRNGKLYFSETEDFNLLQKTAAFLERRCHACAALGLALRRMDFRARAPHGAGAGDESSGETGYAVLDRFAALGKERGFKPLLVYFPSKADFKNRSAAEPAGRLLKYCSEKNLACFSLDHALLEAEKRGEKPFFRIDDHWTAAGHAAAARALRDFLREKQMLEPAFFRENPS